MPGITVSDDGRDDHTLLKTFSGLPVALKVQNSCHTSLVLSLLNPSNVLCPLLLEGLHLSSLLLTVEVLCL